MMCMHIYKYKFLKIIKFKQEQKKLNLIKEEEQLFTTLIRDAREMRAGDCKELRQFFRHNYCSKTLRNKIRMIYNVNMSKYNLGLHYKMYDEGYNGKKFKEVMKRYNKSKRPRDLSDNQNQEEEFQNYCWPGQTSSSGVTGGVKRNKWSVPYGILFRIQLEFDAYWKKKNNNIKPQHPEEIPVIHWIFDEGEEGDDNYDEVWKNERRKKAPLSCLLKPQVCKFNCDAKNHPRYSCDYPLRRNCREKVNHDCPFSIGQCRCLGLQGNYNGKCEYTSVNYEFAEPRYTRYSEQDCLVGEQGEFTKLFNGNRTFKKLNKMDEGGDEQKRKIKSVYFQFNKCTEQQKIKQEFIDWDQEQIAKFKEENKDMEQYVLGKGQAKDIPIIIYEDYELIQMKDQQLSLVRAEKELKEYTQYVNDLNKRNRKEKKVREEFERRNKGNGEFDLISQVGSEDVSSQDTSDENSE